MSCKVMWGIWTGGELRALMRTLLCKRFAYNIHILLVYVTSALWYKVFMLLLMIIQFMCNMIRDIMLKVIDLCVDFLCVNSKWNGMDIYITDIDTKTKKHLHICALWYIAMFFYGNVCNQDGKLNQYTTELKTRVCHLANSIAFISI